MQPGLVLNLNFHPPIKAEAWLWKFLLMDRHIEEEVWEAGKDGVIRESDAVLSYLEIQLERRVAVFAILLIETILNIIHYLFPQ